MDKGRFKKGHIPYNKGLKRGSVSTRTEFQPGHVPATFKGFGTPCIINRKTRRKEIYVTIESSKVSAISRGKEYIRHRRTTYNRYLWEKHHGAIPKGYIVFNTGPELELENRHENLKLITRRELLQLNTRK